MTVIGITGGIGSGKSVVSRLLETYGVPVYNADRESKRLTVSSPVLRECLKREYYINDAGLQMDILGRSAQARYFELAGRPELAPFPENGYKGAYIRDLARTVLEREGDRFLAEPPSESLPWFKRYAGDVILGRIKEDLGRFGVRFDVWFSEATLYERDLVRQAMEDLKRRDFAFESDGALWFKTTDFEDDKDRVLIRNSGAPCRLPSSVPRFSPSP